MTPIARYLPSTLVLAAVITAFLSTSALAVVPQPAPASGTSLTISGPDSAQDARYAKNEDKARDKDGDKDKDDKKKKCPSKPCPKDNDH